MHSSLASNRLKENLHVLPSQNRCQGNVLRLPGQCLSFVRERARRCGDLDDPTQNMSCTAKVCIPTATDAVLNAGDLQNLLANSSVKVKTSSRAVRANDIIIAAPLSWSSTFTLNLLAGKRIIVGEPIQVAGDGGLNLTFDGSIAGGRGFFFEAGAYITFANLNSALIINNESYKLEPDLASLAHAGEGPLALANSYDASADGTYTDSPVPALGLLEGLGNIISNVSINSNSDASYLGTIGSAGTIRNIGLLNANVTVQSGATAGWRALRQMRSDLQHTCQRQRVRRWL
jgi:hypothetical protein